MADPAQKPTGTLEDYAAGLNNVNLEVQRQGRAFGHLRQLVAQLQSLQQNPAASKAGLPVLSFNVPTEGQQPEKFEVDLASLSPDVLATCLPLFTSLVQFSGDHLVAAWGNVHQLDAAAQAIIAAANAQRPQAT